MKRRVDDTRVRRADKAIVVFLLSLSDNSRPPEKGRFSTRQLNWRRHSPGNVQATRRGRQGRLGILADLPSLMEAGSSRDVRQETPSWVARTSPLGGILDTTTWNISRPPPAASFLPFISSRQLPRPFNILSISNSDLKRGIRPFFSIFHFAWKHMSSP